VALTPRHVALAVALAATLIAVALLPPSPDPHWARLGQAPRSRADQLHRAVETVARRVEALELRDRLRARLVRAPLPAGAPPVLWLEPDVPAATATLWRTAWDTVATRLGPMHRRSAVLVAVARDTANGLGHAWYFLPRVTDGHTCVVAVLVGERRRDLRPASPADDLLSFVGLCAFYGIFGAPGPAVEQWLAEEASSVGNMTQWLAATPRGRPSETPLSPPDGSPTRTLLEWMLDARYRGDIEETACAAGRTMACRRLLARSEPLLAHRSTGLRPLGILDRRVLASWYRSEVDFFLSDLVRDHGPERFARFWSSVEPADAAFRTAYGESLEQRTSAWLRAGREVRAGPSIRASSVLVSLVATLVVVGLAAAWTTRRQAR